MDFFVFRVSCFVFGEEWVQLGIGAYEEEGLSACVGRAFAIAQPGDTILYSPAFSSFGRYFANEYDRGEQFMKLIEPLL